ncbi:DUF2911 domain-containing protein [Lutibacter sp.]|uniref:DUF2911 domain-containing protein n=1 Tax=Lutibacter sp. TaxID=1925666 RepID=UPI001A2094D0|nr:DUF2911 domain-containing protein [Lutibacter sp.]MBI9042656.1 DUF2911 domain-containing protein [Lutibacter sp.]
MKSLKLTLVLLLLTTIVFAQKSPRKQVNGTIGHVTVDIDYGAPSVRERVIWGELVPYNQVWRAGANENTTISFDEEVTVKNKSIYAGKYGFFIIPKEDSDWTIILSSENDAWGSNSYNENEDVVRLSVTPQFINENQEELTYSVNNDGIVVAWEKVRLLIPIQ